MSVNIFLNLSKKKLRQEYERLNKELFVSFVEYPNELTVILNRRLCQLSLAAFLLFGIYAFTDLAKILHA